MIPDNERPPLSYREYSALRQLFGMVVGWDEKGSELRQRLKLVPHGWRDARMLAAVSSRLLDGLLGTIPVKKLVMIRKELDNTWCEVTVRNSIAPVKKEMFTYVEQETLERVTDRAMELECMFCEKRGKDARKCQLRQDIEELRKR